MYAFRDRYAKEWGLNLIREPCPPIEADRPDAAAGGRSAARKTRGLKLAIEKHGFDGLIAGIRRDEEATRAKERFFTPRGAAGDWNLKDQPPEFWDQYNTELPGQRTLARASAAALDRGRHLALHAAREGIPVDRSLFRQERQALPLARRPGHHPPDRRARPRRSTRSSPSCETTRGPERSGRAMDHESEDAFERLRTAGYM